MKITGKLAKHWRPLAIAVAMASFTGLGVLPASAAAHPNTGCSISFPAWNEETEIISPSDNTVYKLQISNGTLEAHWADNFTVMSISYIKTGGSTITADFRLYWYSDRSGNSCFYKDDDGSFTESAGQTRSFAWDGVVDGVGFPTDVAMYVPGQGYFGFIFNYNNEG